MSSLLGILLGRITRPNKAYSTASRIVDLPLSLRPVIRTMPSESGRGLLIFSFLKFWAWRLTSLSLLPPPVVLQRSPSTLREQAVARPLSHWKEGIEMNDPALRAV